MSRRYDGLSITACSLTNRSGGIFYFGFVQVDNNGVLVTTNGDNVKQFMSLITSYWYHSPFRAIGLATKS
jgi:hypothetical protein